MCALAAVGWMRNTNSTASAYPLPIAAQYQAADPQGSNQFAAPPPVYTTDGYYPTRTRPVYIRQPGEVQQFQPGPRRVSQQPEYYTDPQGRRRGRTKTHSVEIVAGTAAVGAVIGALAGGGKGAAIGAASGAGAGFVYDRITHNH